MFIELSNFWIILINVLGIPLAHISLSILATRLPANCFDCSSKPRMYTAERSLHDTLFQTRKWKSLLPDAAPWMGGFPKAKLLNAEPAYLKRFVIETRRGEWSHWAQLIVISAFICWNPWPANLVIIIYAVLMNIPCILNLRYTRIRLLSVLNRSSHV